MQSPAAALEKNFCQSNHDARGFQSQDFTNLKPITKNQNLKDQILKNQILKTKHNVFQNLFLK